MPYIPSVDRSALDTEPQLRRPRNAGELNYVITRTVNRYIQQQITASGKQLYTTLNEAIGVLECAKLELYRRVATPYENEKMKQNGDVYG